KEIAEVQAGRKGHMIIKINSLSDRDLIKKLYEAAEVGVEIDLIVRGIYCAVNQKRFKQPIRAISIIDEFLEHARVMYFYNAGHEHIFISSADWMTRNLDHRVEAAIRITNPDIKKQLKDMLCIQLKDNVKARYLDENLSNEYVADESEAYRSQLTTHQYLKELLS
ncbi:phospholipase D-like domain-containing protein, partial [Brucella sp. 21LCYQ03]|nr:phospholipase D-like domain-containing protein [Brucella sp. 21LCYQ03]